MMAKQREGGSGICGWLRVFHRLQSRCLAIVTSRFDEGRTIPKLTHVVVADRIQFLMGCWMRVSIQCWLLAGGCPQCLDIWASPYSSSQDTAGFIRGSKQETEC